jgi:uncharacterized RDD family membrane protein YckC
MNSEVSGLSVDSVTGIDVSLPVAGPGARSAAFLVDWTIRVIIALSWYVVGALIYNGSLSLVPPGPGNARWFALIAAPASAIYFLYHPVLELAMRGSTPGKRMAGVRIVTRDGGVPGAGALLVRNVFRLVDSLPMFYGLGLVTVVLSRDNLRIGDMAAGTLLVFDREDARLAAQAPEVSSSSRLDTEGADILAELLERWPALSPQARARLARGLLTRYGEDPGDLGDAADDAWLARLARLARPDAQS